MIMHPCLTTRHELGVEPNPRALGSMKHTSIPHSSWPHWTPASKAYSGASTGRSCHHGKMQMALHRHGVDEPILDGSCFDVGKPSVNIFSAEIKNTWNSWFHHRLLHRWFRPGLWKPWTLRTRLNLIFPFKLQDPEGAFDFSGTNW